jgi:hypothetical protein
MPPLRQRRHSRLEPTHWPRKANCLHNRSESLPWQWPQWPEPWQQRSRRDAPCAEFPTARMRPQREGPLECAIACERGVGLSTFMNAHGFSDRPSSDRQVHSCQREPPATGRPRPRPTGAGFDRGIRGGTTFAAVPGELNAFPRSGHRGGRGGHHEASVPFLDLDHWRPFERRGGRPGLPGVGSARGGVRRSDELGIARRW